MVLIYSIYIIKGKRPLNLVIPACRTCDLFQKMIVLTFPDAFFASKQGFAELGHEQELSMLFPRLDWMFGGWKLKTLVNLILFRQSKYFCLTYFISDAELNPNRGNKLAH